MLFCPITGISTCLQSFCLSILQCNPDKALAPCCWNANPVLMGGRRHKYGNSSAEAIVSEKKVTTGRLV